MRRRSASSGDLCDDADGAIYTANSAWHIEVGVITNFPFSQALVEVRRISLENIMAHYSWNMVHYSDDGPKSFIHWRRTAPNPLTRSHIFICSAS